MQAREAVGRLGRLLAGLGVLLLAAACGPGGAAPKPEAVAGKAALTLEQVIQGAKAEGKLNVAGPSNLGDDGFQKLVAAMNAKYGTSVQGTFSTSGNLPDIVSKVITERATGGKPTWDSVLLNDSYMVTLSTEDQLEKRPYRELFGLGERAINFDSKGVGYAHQLVLPAVNANLVPPAERPKTWDEVVDPKWQRKIAIHSAVHHLVRLSQVWGDEKATEYAKKLAALNPKIGLINETFKWLTLGETLISFTQTNSQMDTALKRGEPVAWAIEVRPAIAPTYHCGALKDAPNSNAATLFCGFMADKAALDIWGEKVGKQSIFDPSTTLGEIYAKSPDQVVLWDDKFPAAEFEARDKKYQGILGFR